MSKNIVDTIIKFCNNTNTKMMLIPSRRQIENNGGYVNNWKTIDFCNYVKSRSSLIYLERDHSGPGQGQYMDDGLDSLQEDCKYFDIIHIDPWKKYSDYNKGLNKTIELINLCYHKNNNLYFEVSTEEAIRHFTVQELDKLMSDLKNKLKPEIYKKIIYLVIQSGTSLKDGVNTGTYDENRLKKMIELKKKYNVLTKEHNGDWITNNEIKDKFNIGLDAINIAPEFGMIETKVILSEIEKLNRIDLFENFYKICLESNKWIKWVNSDFKPDDNKRKLIEICGHYVFSNKEFLKIKKELKRIDEKIIKKIEKKLEIINYYVNFYKNLI